MKKLLQIRFVKTLTISTLFLIQIVGTAYAQEKQKACLAPMGALGSDAELPPCEIELDLSLLD